MTPEKKMEISDNVSECLQGARDYLFNYRDNVDINRFRDRIEQLQNDMAEWAL